LASLGAADQAEPDPPPPHVAIAPALDVPRDVPQRADQILDAIRRREEATFLGIGGSLVPALGTVCLGRRDSHADQGAAATQFSTIDG